MSGRAEILDAAVYVAGADTLIGQAIWRRLKEAGAKRLLAGPGEEPELTDPGQVEEFFASRRPVHVIVAAGLSGGIELNRSRPASLMVHNLLVTTNLISAAHRHGVKKLLYLASSCAYPRLAPQPLHPDHLLGGPLEPTNEGYALAKLAGVKLCQAFRQEHGDDFIVGIPANVFGPGDDFSLDNSHVIAALMRRMHLAKLQGQERVVIWGSGQPRREFIYCDDLAESVLVALERHASPQPLNLGAGLDYSIAELAQLIGQVVGYQGELVYDRDKPDGMPRKILDSSLLLSWGWSPRWDMAKALRATYQWYLEQQID